MGAIDQVDGRAQAQAEAIVSYVPDAVLERFVITGDSVFVSVRVSADSYLPGLDIDVEESAVIELACLTHSDDATNNTRIVEKNRK